MHLIKLMNVHNGFDEKCYHNQRPSGSRGHRAGRTNSFEMDHSKHPSYWEKTNTKQPTERKEFTHSGECFCLKVAHQHDATISQRFSQYSDESQVPPSWNSGGHAELAFEKLNDRENKKKIQLNI